MNYESGPWYHIIDIHLFYGLFYHNLCTYHVLQCVPLVILCYRCTSKVLFSYQRYYSVTALKCTYYFNKMSWSLIIYKFKGFRLAWCMLELFQVEEFSVLKMKEKISLSHFNSRFSLFDRQSPLQQKRLPFLKSIMTAIWVRLLYEWGSHMDQARV